MRLGTIHEGKAIILSDEAYELARKVTSMAWEGYQSWHEKIKDVTVWKLGKELSNYTIQRTAALHPRFRPDDIPIVFNVTYLYAPNTEGAYRTGSAEEGIVSIALTIGCTNPKLRPAFIYETIVHELTHAVDPKVSKYVPGSMVQYDVNKIRHGTDAERFKEFGSYARQSTEVDASLWQVANRFVRFFVDKGLKKTEILEKAKNFTPETLDEVFKTHAYGWRSATLLARKASRRRLINTIIHIIDKMPNNEETSSQRRLTEADMSRRQFLKLGGQAAMAAATPQSALKGLVGSTTAAIGTPKTPQQMKLALLQLIKDRNLEALWLQNAKRTIEDWKGYPQFFQNMDKKHQTEQDVLNSLVADDRNELMTLAELNDADYLRIEDLHYVLDSFNDDSYFRNQIFGGILPDWVTRYRVSRFMGREVGIDHPFVKDRDKWRDYLGSTEYGIPDANIENEFIKIIAQSATPQRVKSIFGSNRPKYWTQEELDKRYEDTYGNKPPSKTKPEPEEKPEEPKRVDSDDPDSWRTQSVEFEHKLVARLRHL